MRLEYVHIIIENNITRSDSQSLSEIPSRIAKLQPNQSILGIFSTICSDLIGFFGLQKIDKMMINPKILMTQQNGCQHRVQRPKLCHVIIWLGVCTQFQREIQFSAVSNSNPLITYIVCQYTYPVQLEKTC